MSLAHGGQVLVSDASEMLLRDRVALRAARGAPAAWSARPHAGVPGRRRRSPGRLPRPAQRRRLPGNLPRHLTLAGREGAGGRGGCRARADESVWSRSRGVGGVGKSRLALEVGAELAAEFPDGVWIVELGVGRRPGIGPCGDRDHTRHHPAGRDAAGRHDRRDVGGPTAAPAWSTTANTSSAQWPRCIDDPPGASSQRHDAGHVARDPRARPRSAVHGRRRSRSTAARPRMRSRSSSIGRGRCDPTSDCVNRRPRPRSPRSARRSTASRSASSWRRAHGRDERDRGQRPSRRSVPAARTARHRGPERQLTLRHTVEWSYDLLSEAEQDLFRSMSVFAGGFDLASVVRGRRRR